MLGSTCQNCHGDLQASIGAANVKYLTHAISTLAVPTARTSRLMMDKAEEAKLGHVLGGAKNVDGTDNPDVATERQRHYATT